jgi:hypothetical protein
MIFRTTCCSAGTKKISLKADNQLRVGIPEDLTALERMNR